ncbi:MAG: hypothetical protein ABI461_11685, partial [Polyangiaceae bacterium]
IATDQTAAQIAAELTDAASIEEATRVSLRVLAPRGARKLVAKLFGGGKDHASRAARGSALVARGYRQITAQIDDAGDDVVSGES